jgi:hypothetical protein
MKRPAIFFALCVTAAACGCWRPYYGQTYAQPAYPAAPVYSQPAPVYSQPAPVYQAPQVIQQPYCQPNPCCTPY